MNLFRVWRLFRNNPRFLAMRAVSRFRLIRKTVQAGVRVSGINKFDSYRRRLRNQITKSEFFKVDCSRIVNELKSDGVSFGLDLDGKVVQLIRNYADKAVVYADRNPRLGFLLKDRVKAEAKLGKPILVAQYLNVESQCKIIRSLRCDPVLEYIAAEYLGNIPTHVGTNLWWTFPVEASEQEKAKHAHVFHYDLDDFAFVKFFFYITDVKLSNGDGAHVCVLGSHEEKKHKNWRDRFLVRRFSDQEIVDLYGQGKVVEILGEAGQGFAEDTLCIHKGITPTQNARLLLQFQFALFDYGVQHDQIPLSKLAHIV